MKFIVICFSLYLPCIVSAQHLSLKKIQVETEEGYKTEAYFGYLDVLLNREHPEKGKTKIAFEIYKSANPRPETPIYFLAGGPGGSGLEFARSAHHSIIKKLQELADVIVIDQRGCGGHDPRLLAPKDLKCRPEQSLEDFLKAPSTATAFEAWNQKMKSEGIDISDFNTIENAADILDLQKALGHSKINLWGFSYGTHLALAYMKYYPNQVERAVLGAISGLDQRVRSPLNMDSVFFLLDKMIQSSPEMARYFPEGLVSTIKNSLAKLDSTPQHVRNAPFVQQKTEIYVNRYDLITALSILGNESWFMSDIPAFFYNVSNGNYAFAGYYVHAATKSKNFGTAMTYAAHLASGAPGSVHDRVALESQYSIFSDAINFPYNAIPINSWHVRDLGDDFREAFHSEIPVLFFSGDLDFRTTAKDAEVVRKQFVNSSHIIIKNTNHQVWLASPEVPNLMFAFFKGQPTNDRTIDRSFFEFRHPDGEKLIYELSMVAKEANAENLLSKVNDHLKKRGESRLTFSSAVGLIDNLSFTNELDKAIVVATQMVEQYPDYFRSHQKLGDLFLKAKMKEKSKECYSQALKLNPYSLKTEMALR